MKYRLLRLFTAVPIAGLLLFQASPAPATITASAAPTFDQLTSLQTRLRSHMIRSIPTEWWRASTTIGAVMGTAMGRSAAMVDQPGPTPPFRWDLRAGRRLVRRASTGKPAATRR